MLEIAFYILCSAVISYFTISFIFPKRGWGENYK